MSVRLRLACALLLYFDCKVYYSLMFTCHVKMAVTIQMTLLVSLLLKNLLRIIRAIMLSYSRGDFNVAFCRDWTYHLMLHKCRIFSLTSMSCHWIWQVWSFFQCLKYQKPLASWMLVQMMCTICRLFYQCWPGSGIVYCILHFYLHAWSSTGLPPKDFGACTVHIPISKMHNFSAANSNDFRGIALSSVLCKLFDNAILEKFHNKLCTSDLKFGSK